MILPDGFMLWQDGIVYVGVEYPHHIELPQEFIDKYNELEWEVLYDGDERRYPSLWIAPRVPK
jgi:hypothetical protein